MLISLLRSTVAGFAATVPMTLWMLLSDRILPPAKKEPLPPERVTMELADNVGVEPEQLSRSQKNAATSVNHFAFGSAIAVPFVLFGKPTVKKGILFGLLVWIANYMGLLPKLGLYPNAKNKDARMNFVMLVAHLIWGGSLGYTRART